MAVATAKLEERVNLRLSTEVYKPYARLAELMGVTVTEVMRDCLSENLEVVETLVAMAEKAQAGDKEGSYTLVGSMIRMYRSYLDHQELLLLSGGSVSPAGAVPQS